MEEDHWKNVWPKGLWNTWKQVPNDHWWKEAVEQRGIKIHDGFANTVADAGREQEDDQRRNDVAYAEQRPRKAHLPWFLKVDLRFPTLRTREVLMSFHSIVQASRLR